MALTGACRAGVVPATTHRPRGTSTERVPGAWRCSVREAAWHRSHRVPRGADPPLHATRQAAGASSAWSQPSNPPPRDRADGATLGRRDANASRRIRRPALRDVRARGPLPTCRLAPLSRGHAIPSSARLMGRRDARPHNADRKAFVQIRMHPDRPRSDERPRRRRRIRASPPCTPHRGARPRGAASEPPPRDRRGQ